MNGTLQSKWKFTEKGGSAPEVFHFNWSVSKYSRFQLHFAEK